ncbi:MAG TPA: hypothetical protein VH331_11470 [Allosphingosinicella sp.]|jgi:hypothetical protein|nr:hypothetical protein [Allosphingosinicella sp.]
MIEAFEEVLADVDERGRTMLGDEWMGCVEQALRSLEAAYPTLTEEGREPIDYSALPVQGAYLYAYALPRAAFTYEFLKRHREAIGRPLFDGPNLVVVSFGGGPASELVGLAQYLGNEEFGETVDTVAYRVFDKDGEWAEIAEAVAENINTRIRISMTYRELDLADSERAEKVDLSRVDLVILSYIMSELCALKERDAIQANMQRMFSSLPSGSKMLFVESKHPTFIKYFQGCKLVAGLRQRNDDGGAVNLVLPDLTRTYRAFEERLGRSPRMDGNIVSKWILRA